MNFRRIPKNRKNNATTRRNPKTARGQQRPGVGERSNKTDGETPHKALTRKISIVKASQFDLDVLYARGRFSRGREAEGTISKPNNIGIGDFVLLLEILILGVKG